MNAETRHPKILECTLRDGSYVINFRFTARQTRTIAQALDQAGFPFIEVGHGVGLGASEAGKGLAAARDEEYMAAAAEAVTRQRWGMFCIPGIATLDHLDLAADYRMPFVRVGTNINEVESSRPFIEKAKKQGMYVCANFMKSYARSPEEFVASARRSRSFGADLIYLVDSAGGMMPHELRQYILAVREQLPDLPLGFHGHDNLGMGVANTLTAIGLGVELVDSSLQGFGRGGGNACTEQLLCAMLRSGFPVDQDPLMVMEIGRQTIQPLIESRGIHSLNVVSGLALFHSSYMPIIEEYAMRFGVDPHRLILAVSAVDKTEAPRALVEQEARRLAAEPGLSEWLTFGHYYHGREQE
ncbi:MAG: 4-hydroxy-2-oxovalerate aldolase [Magnetococcales bacterium]|nr:4-hydroxy-2-oxovalerate aldolase [Magnetococcales bacterium]